MNTIDEKEILELDKLKAEYRRVIQDLKLNSKKVNKEIWHMSFKEWAMVASFFTALGAITAKLLIVS
jgi:hypothetical protein